MKAKIQGIDKLFGDTVSYRIPQFQRAYAWSEKQWQPLWEDARKMADHILKHGQEDLLPHFIGSIVLQPIKSADAKFSQILVVDGQQRLTTLQLLLKATQKAFQESLNNTRKFKNLDKLLLNDQERTGNDPDNKPKIRQSNNNDQEVFKAVIRDDKLECQSHDITKAYNYFHENVHEWVSRHANVDVRATALHNALVKQLEVVSIILDTREKPHLIFEILNSRGEPLKQGDLVKATIMYEADVVDDEEQAKELFGMFEDIWWHCVVERGRERYIRLDGFLNYWIMMRVSKYVKIPRTAAEFRYYIDGCKPNINNIKKVAQDINEAGKVYRNIEEKKIEGIKLFLERVIETMEIGVIIPPLLWLYTNNVSEEEQQRSVRALESYLVRRMLCKMGVMGLNIVFIEMVKRLKEQKDQPVDDVIIQFLKKKLGGNLWPDDFSVISYLTKNPMPGNAARKKMIFEAIETHLIIEEMIKRLRVKDQPVDDVVIQFLKKNTDLLGDTSKLTVEPILPKNWANEDWPFPKDTVDKAAAAVDRNDSIKLIGNLTLASKGLNFAIPNKSWEDKKKALHQHSRLYLNKELLDNAPEVWDETAIVKRSEQLAQEIVQIWPHADGI